MFCKNVNFLNPFFFLCSKQVGPRPSQRPPHRNATIKGTMFIDFRWTTCRVMYIDSVQKPSKICSGRPPRTDLRRIPKKNILEPSGGRFRQAGGACEQLRWKDPRQCPIGAAGFRMCVCDPSAKPETAASGDSLHDRQRRGD